jgi:cytochrome c oxidase cbb3-type subunit 4
MDGAVGQMDMGVVRGVITIATMICFLGICWWAYRSGNRSRFEEDAMLPFADEVEAGERLGGERER